MGNLSALGGNWDNHGIPPHYENYVVRVSMRGNQVYMALPLSISPATYEPHSIYGIDILIRDDWTDVYKVCFDFPVTPDNRGRILRHIRKTFYPTARYYAHIEGSEETK